MAKTKVEKGSLEEKCLAKLYARKLACDWWEDLFPNKGTTALYEKYDYVPPKYSDKITKPDAARIGIAEYNVIQAAKRYQKDHPKCVFVNLGCGFSTVFPYLDNGQSKGYNVDTKEVLIARKEAVGKDEREQGIIADIMEDDYSWFDKIEWNRDDGIFFYAIDLFSYMKREDVKRIVSNIADTFRDGMIVFDAYSAEGVKRVLKTRLSEDEVKNNCGFYFSVDDEAQISKWTVKIVDIWKRPYLYYLKDKASKLGLITTMACKTMDSKRENLFIELTFKR